MLYKMSNYKDINKILKYGKARGKYLLHMLLPNLSDINELYVLESYEDYLKIASELPEKVILRADAELGKAPTLGVRGCAIEKDKIPDYIKLVKKNNKDGTVLCIDTKVENEKSSISGSFNIHFEWGHCIIIEYLSEGFDIGGITKGEDIHEIYYIPWNQILFTKHMNEYKVYNISDEQYKESAIRKINSLVKKGLEEEAKTIPLTYKPINGAIHKMIFDEIIIPILYDKNKIYGLETSSFGIQGMIRKNKEKYILQPVEFRTSERHVEKDFYNKYLVPKEKQYKITL